jgi:IclR family transcriptional regulator, KDG regulon repressor
VTVPVRVPVRSWRDEAALPQSSGDSPQLLQRTFSVLALFTPERQEWTVTEIGRECGLAVPTVHRILSALRRNGYLVRDDNTKRYRFGPAILRMGRTASLAVNMRSLAAPLLHSLARRTTQTALLTVISDDHRNAVCIDRVESSEPLRLSVQPGRQLPLHAGASQKILLAFMPEDEFQAYVDEPLSSLCTSTISEAGRLAQEVATIRQRGWASSYQETNLGVWGLSVAIIDETGRAEASIGVAGPGERKPRNINPWLQVLAQAAAELAEPLGLRPSLPLREHRAVGCKGSQRLGLTPKENIR